jgi:hypothetical protein
VAPTTIACEYTSALTRAEEDQIVIMVRILT